jgi:predicted dehydrogenase
LGVSPERVHLCILGCGRAAEIHSRASRSLGSRVALSYASRRPGRAAEYKQRFGGIGAFDSYEEACASWDVDGVVVCTPPGGHVAQVELAARHRKAILLEKPAARTPLELEPIEVAVRAAGVPCMVAENYLFKPLVGVLQAHLASGDIGAPVLIEVSRAQRNRVSGWRSDADEMGGGALLEGGVHWVNLLGSLGGAIHEVIAMRPLIPVPTVPVEDTLQVMVRFESGAVGKLLHSWRLPNPLRAIQMSRIYGTDGTAYFESNGLFCIVAGRRTRLRFPGVRDLMGYRAMWRHFVECLRTGGQPRMSLGAARRDLEVIHAAYRSLDTGRIESVGRQAG